MGDRSGTHQGPQGHRRDQRINGTHEDTRTQSDQEEGNKCGQALTEGPKTQWNPVAIGKTKEKQQTVTEASIKPTSPTEKSPPTTPIALFPKPSRGEMAKG